MRERRGLDDQRLLCSGPGRLCQALGVTHALNGLSLDRKPFRVGRGRGRPKRVVHAGVRIGISKSEELPWRFVLAGSPFLSKPMRAPGAARDARSGLIAHRSGYRMLT